MSRSRRVLLNQAPSQRRQPLMKSHTTVSASVRFGEVVGGTTAECAAVCCCCPCGLMHLMVLALYKVPAALCRKALRNKRRGQLIKKGMKPQRLRHRCHCGCDDIGIPNHSVCSYEYSSDMKLPESEEVKKEVEELEKEMWDMFYSTGFWRSPSTREEPPNVIPNFNRSNFQVVSL